MSNPELQPVASSHPPHLYVRKSSRVYTSDELKKVPTPEGTVSWQPVPHHVLVDHVRDAMSSLNIKIIDEQHGVAAGGSQYFGLFAVSPSLKLGDDGNLSVRPAFDDYHTMVGLRNCHGKRFSVGLAWGARVMVCSNLSFTGEVVIRRKHTSRVLDDLPSLVTTAMLQITAMEQQQGARFGLYKRHRINKMNDDIDNLIISAYDKEVISSSHIGLILSKWRSPESFGTDISEEKDGSIWGLMNACTEVLRDRVSVDSLVQRTRILQEDILDPYCLGA